MQPFRKLEVWQEAHALVLGVYRVSRGFPSSERYGLTSQLRRAALSVPTNIVEGAKRRTRLDYARFLNQAEASLAETDYLLLAAVDLGFAARVDVAPLAATIERLARRLSALRQRVEGRGAAEPVPPYGAPGPTADLALEEAALFANSDSVSGSGSGSPRCQKPAARGRRLWRGASALSGRSPTSLPRADQGLAPYSVSLGSRVGTATATGSGSGSGSGSGAGTGADPNPQPSTLNPQPAQGARRR